MLKVEMEGARLDHYLPGSHECRLESDALLADVALGALLGGLANITNSPEVGLIETVLVTLHDDSVVVDTEGDVGFVAGLDGLGELVVICILQQLKDETSRAVVQIPRQALIRGESQFSPCGLNMLDRNPT